MHDTAGPTPGTRSTGHVLNAAVLTAVALLGTACAGQDAGALRSGTTPASPSSVTTAEAQATASARAEVAGRCPAVSDVPAPVTVDEGQRLSEGLTLEQATRRAQDEQQASVLDAWLRCTYLDAYGQLRVAHEPQFHAVVALTRAAGPDPLAGAPLGVLEGRVEVEVTPFSALQMQVMRGRVDAALDACGLVTSSWTDLGVIHVGTGTAGTGARDRATTGQDTTGQDTVTQDDPGVEAVERCLDAADLGARPGRAQVEVTAETSRAVW